MHSFNIFVRPEVFVAVIMKITVFWDVTHEIWWQGNKVSQEPAPSIYPPSLKMEAAVPPKCWYLPM
jgi:hypothetical protein